MNNRRIFKLHPKKAEAVVLVTQGRRIKGLKFKGGGKQGPNRIEEYRLEQVVPFSAQCNIIYCDRDPAPSEIEIIAPEASLALAQEIVEVAFNFKLSENDLLLG